MKTFSRPMRSGVAFSNASQMPHASSAREADLVAQFIDQAQRGLNCADQSDPYYFGDTDDLPSHSHVPVCQAVTTPEVILIPLRPMPDLEKQDPFVASAEREPLLHSHQQHQVVSLFAARKVGPLSSYILLTRLFDMIAYTQGFL